jgi:hypothetical protein
MLVVDCQEVTQGFLLLLLLVGEGVLMREATDLTPTTCPLEDTS